MPVPRIELEEVTIIVISDDALEACCGMSALDGTLRFDNTITICCWQS